MEEETPRVSLVRRMMNLFRDLPARLPGELVETLAESAHVRIERIVSRGHTTPADAPYDQPWAELVVLLSGAARLRFEDPREIIDMRPGDWLTIPTHRRHWVEWTAPDEATVWLAVHYDAGTGNTVGQAPG